MKEQKKKQLIAVLLLVSCFISGYMLFVTSEGGSKQLHNFAQADSLIHKELTDFNISEQQIRISTTRVDSNFSRKTYYVGLPFEFSKTQFHAELNKRLSEFNIKTPAKVTFPEQNVNIHLLYHGTVIRTISLQTDPKLTIERHRASIAITFDEVPDEEILEMIASLGEPIPLVFTIENPARANEIKTQLNHRYNRLLFWFQNDDGIDLMDADPRSALQTIERLEDMMPEAQILQVNLNKEARRELVTQTDLTFVNAPNPLWLNEGLGKASFFEKLQRLEKETSSIAVIRGNETTISWLHEKLPELKKAGVEIISPLKMDF